MKTLLPVVLLGLVLGACCPINRLATRSEPIETVSLGVESGYEVHIYFTRKVSRATRAIAGPLAGVGASAYRFDPLIASLKEPALLRSLQRGLAVAFEDMLGWRSGESALEFNLVIQEIVLTSPGPLTPLTTLWALEATLLDTDRGEIVWRACTTLEIDHGVLSARDLARMEAEAFVAFLRMMTTEVAVQLIGMLKADLPAAGGQDR